MSGDFTRQTFRREKHYSGVRLQQGRVQVDADWNELVDIQHHLERTAVEDVVGPTGMPAEAPGFAIELAVDDLLIGDGRAYVDGILVENEERQETRLQPVSGNGAATVWEVAFGPRLVVGQWLSGVAGAPLRVASEEPPSEQGRQRIRLNRNVGNVAVAVRARTSLAQQPDLPASGLPQKDGHYLVYLDVWERLITSLEDPEIQESALGGPDTAIRTRALWQVRVLSLDSAIAAGAVTDPPLCSDFPGGWDPNAGAAPARLRAWTDPASKDPKPCALPSSTGYRSLENHLYRVEVHVGGRVEDDEVWLKWSRDNAIHRTRLLDVKDGSLVVSSDGRDAAGSFRTSWVEVIDEQRILSGDPGFFVRVGDVIEEKLEIEEVLDPVTQQPAVGGDGLPNTAVLPTSGIVRRWEGGKPVLAKVGTPLPLENAIEVDVTAGATRTGDHWWIPARTLKAAIEWPRDPATSAPVPLPPHGTAHHYCPLALISRNAGAWSLRSDCRNVFLPITRQVELHYVGGDGQEVRPDPADPNGTFALPRPLEVGVCRGELPIQGARVRFRVTGGNGVVAGQGDQGNEVTVTTVANGRASVAWSMDGTNHAQQVTAELLDASGAAVHLPIAFSARLSRADEVAYDPSNCPDLAGRKTVQAAIDALCQVQRAGCATYVVSPGMDWVGVLESLSPGEDAHVCFQRGTYRSPATVVMNDVGHLSLSGVGDGTVIEIDGRETALRFFNCRSVEIENLCVSAPGGSSAIGHIAHLNGVVTMEDCRRVEVRGAAFKCGAGAKKERTCIRVLSAAGRPTESVRIVGNHLTVGFGQVGVLVVNAKRAVVEDNELVVGKRPNSLTLEKLLVDPLRLNKLTGVLVNRTLLEEHINFPDKSKILRAGRFTAKFASAIPEKEWNDLMASDPPQAADIADANAFGGYVNRLVGKAVDQPDLLPSFKSQLDGFGNVPLGRAVKEGLVVAGGVAIRDFADISSEKRNVALVVDDSRIRFDSPISEAEWRRVLGAGRLARPRSDFDLHRNLRDSAKRLLLDPAFRAGFPTVTAWFEGVRTNNPSFAAQGIVLGGQTLGEVRVDSNTITGFREGIHIGVSKREPRGQPHRTVGALSVQNNRIALRLGIDDIQGHYGLFVGNTRRLSIVNNHVEKPQSSSDDRRYEEGIRVWGHLGPYVVIEENSTEHCHKGIRVKSIKRPSPRMWVAADNLAVQGGFDLPGFTRSHHNVTTP